MTGVVVPAYTAAQLRAAEAPLLAAGVPLMARASAAFAGAVIAEARSAPPRPRVLVLAGAGDNGADALFAAAEIAAHADVDLVTVAERWHAAALAAAEGAGARRIPPEQATASDYDLVVDGILGIGGSGGLRGVAREVVRSLLPAVREGRTRVIAVDLPSGVDPDTGDADDVVLPASVTVTFGGAKAGLSAGRGPQLSGEIVLVRLGIEGELDRMTATGCFAVARIIDAGVSG